MNKNLGPRFLKLVTLLVLIARPLLGSGEPPSPEQLARRQELAQSGDLLQSFTPTRLAPETGALADTLDLPPAFLPHSSATGDDSAIAVFSNLGVLKPRRGSTFLLLSSGVAGTGAPEPGTDFSPVGSAGDRASVVLTLDVPPGLNRLSFDFNFLSSEFPDFIGTSFNDTFGAIVTDSQGTRVITAASVNSSTFFAASESQAGGSGFDIFTEDPTGVDTLFGTGLPDAGLTGFETVNVEIASGELVTLELFLEDRGDGILDSAVIVDNLAISGIEVVDPNPTLLSNGKVVTDPNLLRTGGRHVMAAAADGVTQVLLRVTVPGPGSVMFSLVDGSAPEDGSLGLPGSPPLHSSVVAPVVQTAGGLKAFAVYQAPEEFNAGGDDSLAERSLSLRAFYAASSGADIDGEVPFKLVRPPVVLVHGLWSGPESWTFPLKDDSRFSVTRANYRSTNASHFATNQFVPFQSIRTALRNMRDQEVAVTQVELIGHSMGGLLSRNWVNNKRFKRNDNYLQGDVHKLMTLDSPHTGSPLANLLIGLRETVPFGLASAAFRALDKPIDEGAIDDLAKGSAAIQGITSAPVPVHGLVGTGGSDLLAALPGTVGDIHRLIKFLASTNGLFQGLQHDGIVGRKSQEGGLPQLATSVFGGLDGLHTQNTSSSLYSNRLVELQNLPAGSALFAPLPAPSTLSSSMEPFAGALDSASSFQVAQVILDGLNLSSPSEGSTVFSGDVVEILVAPDPGLQVDEVILVGPDVTTVDTSAPFRFNLAIPDDAIGEFQVSAIGKNTSSQFFGSDSVSFFVLSPSTLGAIDLVPEDPFLTGPGTKLQVVALGSFDDGIVRDITSQQLGTEFLSSDPLVASVTHDGVLELHRSGKVTLVARNGNVQDSVTVTLILFADVPEDHFGFRWVEALFAGGITAGCGGENFCPEAVVTRGQMAIFLLRSIFGGGFVPPEATGLIFGDVPASHFAAAWIEALAAQGITAGCGGGNYCPQAPVTRAQMAVFLLRAKFGANFVPTPATGSVFDDVPASHFAAAWIEALALEGITAGCGNGNYCPDSPVTRAQIAVFLVRTFNLPLFP